MESTIQGMKSFAAELARNPDPVAQLSTVFGASAFSLLDNLPLEPGGQATVSITFLAPAGTEELGILSLQPLEPLEPENLPPVISLRATSTDPP